MWEGGPAAPFSGYITKGDHNDVIDQMAGQIFGMANMSYVETHRDEIMDVGSDIYLDKKTGLIIYRTGNGTFVGEGISYLTPVKEGMGHWSGKGQNPAGGLRQASAQHHLR